MTNQGIKLKKEKKKYIPNLAEFYFKPDFDWTFEKAQTIFNKSINKLTDQIHYENCITGMENLPDESINIVIADPPFGLDFNGKESFYNRKPQNVVQGYKEIKIENYHTFSMQWISQIPRILKKSGSAYIFSGWTNLFPILEAISHSGLILRNHIIWEYNFALFTKRKFASSHYHILYLVKDEKEVFFNRIKHYETDVWTIPREYYPNQLKNGTKLPIDLVRKCINYSSSPGDLVLDPFTGNATTQVAAKGEFRHYLGFEMNQLMKDLITQNIAKINTGEFYTPYTQRIPSIEELKEKYPKAYQKYLKKENLKEQ